MTTGMINTDNMHNKLSMENEDKNARQALTGG
jgi:hypothetical protein